MIFRDSICLQSARIALICAAVLWTAVADLGARDGSKDWAVLENCRLIVNPANDGDSFHVSAGTNEYIFRLYLVDAPETDEMTPGRLVAQAKYFGITVPQAIEVGRAAKEFTERNCPSRSPCSRICPMRWAKADSNGFTRLCRLKRVIWESN